MTNEKKIAKRASWPSFMRPHNIDKQDSFARHLQEYSLEFKIVRAIDCRGYNLTNWSDRIGVSMVDQNHWVLLRTVVIHEEYGYGEAETMVVTSYPNYNEAQTSLNLIRQSNLAFIERT